MPLYHSDVYMPPVATGLDFLVMLRYSPHAKEAAVTDRYGVIKLPMVFNSREATLIEAEVERGKVLKALYRLPYNQSHDLCIVLLPDTGLVKTVWLNDVSDTHKTLDTTRYAKGN